MPPLLSMLSACRRILLPLLAGPVFLPLLFVLPSPPHAAAGELFPVYPCIEANVRFWENVYSRYTTTQGILHDQEDLEIVYTVVDLVDWNTPGAASINKKLIRIARQHYKGILTDLAEGYLPETRDEKRVAAMFSSRGSHALLQARDNIRLQIGQKDRFIEGYIRSGAYMPYIKRILTAQELPVELAYLPHVESSFNPEARSKAGAAGLWQFTSSTGRRYLTINNAIDERLDPYFSTRAAALFLKKNHELLGNWPLAITAYNYGTSGMLRAVREYGTYQDIFQSHRTRIFKFAARNFYPEFLAAMNVARRLERHSALIPDRPEATLSVTMPGYALAEDIRNHFRIPEEDFARLNPALGRTVSNGSKYIPKGFPVRIPSTDLTRRLQDSLPASYFHAEQIRDRHYIVRLGDTAGTIARRYHVSLRDLVAANNLDRRATIRIGQRLSIPAPPLVAANIKVVELEDQAKARPN